MWQHGWISQVLSYVKEDRPKKRSTYCMISFIRILGNANEYIVTEWNQWLPGVRGGREGISKGHEATFKGDMFTILNVVRVSWVYTYAHCTLLNRTYEIHTVYCVPIIASVIFRILLFSFREFGGKGESRNAAYLEGDMGSSMDFGFLLSWAML